MPPDAHNLLISGQSTLNNRKPQKEVECVSLRSLRSSPSQSQLNSTLQDAVQSSAPNLAVGDEHYTDTAVGTIDSKFVVRGPIMLHLYTL